MIKCCGRYTGEKLLDERIEVLLEAAWRPAPEGAFPDLPQSPRSNSSAAPPAQPQRAAGYMAPHLRGTGQCKLHLRISTFLLCWSLSCDRQPTTGFSRRQQLGPHSLSLRLVTSAVVSRDWALFIVLGLLSILLPVEGGFNCLSTLWCLA